jgi:predicted glycogen debranching enzyme
MVAVSRIGWRRDEENATDALINREWLVTNGLGGYASSTVAGVTTRGYHGLLVAALPSPLGRTMMFDYLVDQVRLPDGSLHRLSAEETDDRLDLHGASHLEQCRLDLGLPVWIYRLGEFVIEKRVLLVHMQNTVFVRYRLIGAPAEANAPHGLWLFLRPAMHFRPHNAPVSWAIDPYTLCLTGNRFEVSASPALPSLKMRVDGEDPAFEFYPERQEKVSYRLEAARGNDARGTLWSPGQVRVHLTPETNSVLLASTESWETLFAIDTQDAWRFENERRGRLLHVAPEASHDQTTAELVLAADQFVIAPAGRPADVARARAQGKELRSVIAGYHWFTDWGRDTMISLEGLTLCTGQYQTAQFILQSFAHYVRDGLIPNLFPEGSREGLYNTADASLWFFHALGRYLDYTSDRETLHELLPTLKRIVDGHLHGTRFGIKVDPSDGLLRQGQEGFALTWMDALCEGWVVTPRRGKTVEINALWFHALTLMAGWVEAEEPGGGAFYRQMAETVQQSFNRLFWNESGGHLFDVIDAGEPSCDPALRPNQLFAISLPNPVLHPLRWRSVVDAVAGALLTPVGLRSLASDHRDFKPNYHGDLRTRDAAYHQGTVWSWLIGAFTDAWLKVYPGEQAKARDLLSGLQAHLGEACLGSISEVFDAVPPYVPRGCIAQAWGVAELLRAWRLTAPGHEQGEPHGTA